MKEFSQVNLTISHNFNLERSLTYQSYLYLFKMVYTLVKKQFSQTYAQLKKMACSRSTLGLRKSPAIVQKRISQMYIQDCIELSRVRLQCRIRFHKYRILKIGGSNNDPCLERGETFKGIIQTNLLRLVDRLRLRYKVRSRQTLNQRNVS